MEEESVIDSPTGSDEVGARAGTRLWLGMAIAAIVAFAVTGFYLSTSGAWKGWRAVASLNGSRITRAQLDEHLVFLVRLGQLRPEVVSDPARKKEVERLALDDLIARRLVLAEAKRLKIVVGPGEEDVIFGKAHGGQPGEPKLAEAAKKAGEDAERMREEVRHQLLMTRLSEKLTEGVAVGDEDVAKYYEAHKRTFATPETAHLRLLILESREEVERLRSQAVAGKDFETLVRQYSKGGNREDGGDLGWVDPQMLPPAIATTIASMPETGISPVVEAGGRFYVVRVEGRRGARQFSLTEVQDQIRQMLLAERKRAKFNEWIEEQRRTATVEVYLE